jgi:hypothetical protein
MSDEPVRTRSVKLQVRKWTEALVKAHSPLPVLVEVMAELPIGVDEARKAAQQKALSLAKGARRIRSTSALVGGGWVVAVETA